MLLTGIILAAFTAVNLTQHVEITPGTNDCMVRVYMNPNVISGTAEYREKNSGQWIRGTDFKRPVPSDYAPFTILKNLKPDTVYELQLNFLSRRKGRNVKTDFQREFRTLPEKPVMRLKCTPTFENCSVSVIDPAGKSCAVSFREAGSDEWRKPLEFFWFPDEREWRGALLMLKENTEYEVKAEVSGIPLTGRFRTRDSRFPIARTIEITSLPFEFVSGSASGWIRYVAKKPLKGMVTLKKLHHVLLDGIEIDGNSEPMALNIEDCSEIAVRNCDLHHFGRVGVRRFDLGAYSYGAYFVPGEKNAIHMNEAGVRIYNSSKVLVERCFIHSPAGRVQSWFYSHPWGVNAMTMDHAVEGIVIRYNDMAAKDLQRWNDGIGANSNGGINGGFGFNADIYGNLFAFTNDDAVELEGAGHNLRFYLNALENVFCGTSTGRCSLGPVYIFRNLIDSQGDQHGSCMSPLKNGMQIQGKGPVLFLHNTIVPGRSAPVFHSFHLSKPGIPLPRIKGFSRGNIYSARANVFPNNLFPWPCDFDFDLICNRVPSGRQEDQKICAESGQERHAIYAAPRFEDPARGDFRLKKDSPGWKIPFTGLGTRAGAFQDDAVTSLPYRKLPFAADRRVLYSAGNDPVSFEIVSEAAVRIRALVNDDFLAVEPADVRLKPGEKIKFTVRLDPEKCPFARVYRAVVLLRDEQGDSLPVMVSFDRRKINPPAGLHTLNGGFIEVKEAGVYFVFIDGTALSGNVKITVGDKVLQGKTAPAIRVSCENVVISADGRRKKLAVKLKPGKYKVFYDAPSIRDSHGIIFSRDPDLITRSCPHGMISEDFSSECK